MSDWNTDAARRLYNVTGWGEGYFDINAAGHVVVRPRREAGPAIDLFDVAQRLSAMHLSYPVLLRFTDILRDRIDTLCGSFDQAMAELDYAGGYTAVYPVKVNQQHSVVEEIVRHGGERVGLEAGSKPELMAVLGIARPGSLIVCNGYKDREYLRLALVGQTLGFRVFIVIEKLSELEILLAEAGELGLPPAIGLRVRLASAGSGKWQNTGGEKSKFGLSAAQVLAAVERLREAGRLEALQMLHFHLGSQLVNIRDIQRGMQECARFYAELRALGVPVTVVDVGGGLGVDYEGTRSRHPCSMNYSVAGYAHNIVRALQEVCAAQDLPPPHIVSESGRALTAHHAVLVTDVIDEETVPVAPAIVAPPDDAPRVLADLWAEHERLGGTTGAAQAVEIWHDTRHWMQEVQEQFRHGLLTLADRARAEALFVAISRRVQVILRGGHRRDADVLAAIDAKLADKLFGNFSLFQSMPDVWAIEQIFPVMPLHRLDESPTRRAVIEDITCDSDGRIDHYVEGEGIEASLPVHPLRLGEPYLLGFFLLGAYQEILGDIHNLFGDTDSVHVVLDGEGGYRLEHPLQGDTVDTVLRYVHFNPDTLLETYRTRLAATDMPDAQREAWLAHLARGLHGYTYLEKHNDTR